ncbi:MAG TPA: hypothetical protein VK783_03740 [Bacteroidia bacterium]|jgi:hypothetical protein|nr:hypothetical protein [Bacteroidia bacterium]
MQIDINRKAISIGEKYAVYLNGTQQWTASKEIFTWLARLHVLTFPEGSTIIDLDQENFWIKPLFTITVRDKEPLTFTTTSFWKLQYQCIDGNDTYNIYAHFGTKYSVFKNDIQIAYWEESMVNWFDGENIKIYADHNVDKELLISLCLIVDNINSSSNKRNTLNINVGNLGWWLKKFDENWRPKE